MELFSSLAFFLTLFALVYSYKHVMVWKISQQNTVFDGNLCFGGYIKSEQYIILNALLEFILIVQQSNLKNIKLFAKANQIALQKVLEMYSYCLD